MIKFFLLVLNTQLARFRLLMNKILYLPNIVAINKVKKVLCDYKLNNSRHHNEIILRLCIESQALQDKVSFF